MRAVQRTYSRGRGATGPCRFNDPFVKLLGADSARRTLLQQANLRPGYRVLDIGCGTGTFVALIKRVHPEVSVVGLDPDPKGLARAQKKAARARVSIQFDQGFSDERRTPTRPSTAYSRSSCFIIFTQTRGKRHFRTCTGFPRLEDHFTCSISKLLMMKHRGVSKVASLKSPSEGQLRNQNRRAYENRWLRNRTKVGSGALLLGHLDLVITADLATTRTLVHDEGSSRPSLLLIVSRGPGIRPFHGKLCLSHLRWICGSDARELRAFIEDYVKVAVRPVVIPETQVGAHRLCV
jgi:SAM-dependent methyltransferase